MTNLAINWRTVWQGFDEWLTFLRKKGVSPPDQSVSWRSQRSKIKELVEAQVPGVVPWLKVWRQQNDWWKGRGGGSCWKVQQRNLKRCITRHLRNKSKCYAN